MCKECDGRILGLTLKWVSTCEGILAIESEDFLGVLACTSATTRLWQHVRPYFPRVVEGRQLEAPREIVEAEVSYARLPIVREEFGTVLRDRRWTFALLLCKVLRLYLFVKCFETLRDCRRVVAFSSTLLALHFRKLLRPYAIAGGS